jgi:hypothetical protein
LSWLSRLFSVFLHRLSVNTNNSYKAIILLNNITICLVTFGIKIKLLTRIISPSFFFPSCHAPATYVNSRAHMSGAHHPRHGRSIIHRRCVASSTGKGKLCRRLLEMDQSIAVGLQAPGNDVVEGLLINRSLLGYRLLATTLSRGC